MRVVAAFIDIEVTIGANARAIGPMNIDRELIHFIAEIDPLRIPRKHRRGG